MMNRFMAKIQSLVQELRRRRVIRVAVVYAGTGFVILQLAEILVGPFGLGGWTLRLITLALILGFPLTVGLAWVFDVTEEGLVRTASREGPPEEEAPEGGPLTSNAVNVGLLVVVLGGVGWITWTTGFGPQPGNPPPEAEEGETSALGAARPERASQRGRDLDPARVAVLYFDDNSPGDTLTAFADGFTEHLIHRLAQVDGLDVVSRHGVKPYREASPSPDSIARSLGAGSLVEGSVKPVGDSLAVFVQLIDGESQSHLISEVIRRPAKEVFALQNEVARKVSRLLRKRLGRQVQLESWRAGTDRPRAWRLVQRADRLREDARQLKREAGSETALELLTRADSLLAEAESIDPDWNAPTVLRARLTAVRVDPYGESWGERERQIVRRGIEHAEEALRRDSTDAEARMIRGRLRFWLSRQIDDPERVQELTDGAEEDLRIAVREAPGSAQAMHTLSMLLLEGRAEFEQAHYYAERARQADAYLRIPSETHHQLFYAALNEGNFEDAAHWCRTGQRRYPELVQFRNCELLLLATEGAMAPNVDRAWELLDEIRARTDPEKQALYVALSRPQVAAVLARTGKTDSARAVLRRTRRDTTETHPVLAYYQAHTYLLLGQEEQALNLLSSSVERSPQYAKMLANDPWFEPLRNRPRFQKLVSR